MDAQPSSSVSTDLRGARVSTMRISRGLLVIGSTIAALTLASGLGWAARPVMYRDAVVAALDQLRIAHTKVEVRAICWPEPACIVTTKTQTFTVAIIHENHASYGRVTCYDRGGNCYLYLRDLGIERVPLRDVLGARLLPRWLAQLGEDTAAWIHRWL